MSTKDIFHLSGPVHLTTVDWTNSGDQRSVAASLVRGVHVLEKDRSKNRRGSQALAPPWWKSFHFEIYRKLTDDDDGGDDSSIFGAMYELTSSSSNEGSRAPHCVVAFRGTTKSSAHTFMRDIENDIRVIPNRLHHTSCVKTAIKAMRHAVETFGNKNVWIAGYSLGAAIAMLAAKDMAMSGVLLHHNFLFNPPFPSLPIDRIIFGSEKGKFALRMAASVIKAGLALALDVEAGRGGAFAALNTWRPHLFVNPDDLFCSGYIGYFEHRERMERVGVLGKIERVATQNSGVGLMMHALGEEWREPMHLIPSAHVTVNCNRSGCCIEAHRIRQWWSPHLRTETKTYTYNTTVIHGGDDEIKSNTHAE